MVLDTYIHTFIHGCCSPYVYRNVSLSRASVEEESVGADSRTTTHDVAVTTLPSPTFTGASNRGGKGNPPRSGHGGDNGNYKGNSNGIDIDPLADSAPVELIGANIMNNEVLLNSHTKAGYLYQLLKTGMTAGTE